MIRTTYRNTSPAAMPWFAAPYIDRSQICSGGAVTGCRRGPRFRFLKMYAMCVVVVESVKSVVLVVSVERVVLVKSVESVVLVVSVVSLV